MESQKVTVNVLTKNQIISIPCLSLKGPPTKTIKESVERLKEGCGILYPSSTISDSQNDKVYVSKDGLIVESKDKFRLIIEVKSGFLKQNKITIGDEVKVYGMKKKPTKNVEVAASPKENVIVIEGGDKKNKEQCHHSDAEKDCFEFRRDRVFIDGVPYCKKHADLIRQKQEELKKKKKTKDEEEKVLEAARNRNKEEFPKRVEAMKSLIDEKIIDVPTPKTIDEIKEEQIKEESEEETTDKLDKTLNSVLESIQKRVEVQREEKSKEQTETEKLKLELTKKKLELISLWLEANKKE